MTLDNYLKFRNDNIDQRMFVENLLWPDINAKDGFLLFNPHNSFVR